VFVITPDGKAQFQKVETGITGSTDIEVTKGLTSGQEIVTGTYVRCSAHATNRHSQKAPQSCGRAHFYNVARQLSCIFRNTRRCVSRDDLYLGRRGVNKPCGYGCG